MDATELLKAFARSQGIDIKRVDKFLNKFNTPKTLEELMGMPHDLLNHEDYITSIKEPLKSYIKEELDPSRHETITLERLGEALLDDISYTKTKFSEGKISEDDYLEKIEHIEEVKKEAIRIKFGSVEYDW